MRLITKRDDVLARLRAAGRTATPLLCPNAETPDEMEGVMLGASLRAGELDAGPVTIGLGCTISYPDHPQLQGIALGGPGDVRSLADAARTWLGWLGAYADRPGVFDGVDVIPFVDHGWAAHDADLQLMREPWFQDAFGIIMFDASTCDFEENVARTSEFVRSAGARVVVEACPDKVYAYAEIRARNLSTSDMLSRPDEVEDFVQRTGVDLIVPNLGTEHRSSSPEPIEYRHELAREITRRVGPIQALHGTSSLGGRLAKVGRHGICKINYYTGMARAASQAVRTVWNGDTGELGLPIGQACGSFLHRTRRAVIADNVRGLLRCIGSEEGTS